MSVSDTAPGTATVTLAINGLEPGVPTPLRSYADPTYSSVEDIQVTGRDGRAIALEPAPATKHAGQPAAIFPAPSDGAVTVRYRVRLAGRRGDMNEGFAHVRNTSLNERFGLVRGRDLFLLTDPPETVRDAKVSFELPQGWGVSAPWIRERSAEAGAAMAAGASKAAGAAGAVTAERSGRDELEEMVVAPIAFGRFVVERLSIKGADVAMLVESSIPEDVRATLARDLTAATKAVQRDLPRTLGAEYRIVVLPRTPDGDEVIGEGSANAQAATLYPLTTERLRVVTRRLATVGLFDAKRGITFKDPKDSWVAYGFRERVAIDVVAEVRGIPADEVDRNLCTAYAQFPGNRLDLLNLERVLADGGASVADQGLVASTVAPMAIRALESVAGREPMRAWVRKASQKGRVGEFWSEIPLTEKKRLQLRKAWGQGEQKLPITFGREKAEIVGTHPAPNAVARTIRVVSTAQGMGYLENCGCKMSQNGGLARRQSLLRRLRGEREPLLVIDTGSGLTDPYVHADPDAFGFSEEATYQTIAQRMGYTAMVLGHTELARGVKRFDAIERAVPAPYVACNVTRRDGTPFAPPVRSTDIAGLRCHVAGVYTPWTNFRRGSRMDEALDSLVILDPVTSVQAAVRDLPDKDFVVVAGEIPYRVIAAIAKTCPNVDLILPCPQLFMGEMAPANLSGTTQNDYSGFLGRTVVAYSDMNSYGASGVTVGLDAAGRPASATFQNYDLNDSVPEDAGVRAALNAFYASLSTDVTDGASVKTPSAVFGVAPGGAGGWVGSATCADCHEAETEQWRQTPHATALHTLTAAHRDRQPRCVACHVVGLGSSDGYKISEKSKGLAHVQCENCHGPGRAHAADPSSANIKRAVPEGVCVTCHDSEHSDNFIYSERLPRVVHEQRAARAAEGALHGAGAAPHAAPGTPHGH